MAAARASLWALGLVLWAALALAQPQFPQLTGPVVDAAGILNAGDVLRIDAALRAYENRSGHQVVVATVPGLEGYDIRDYGNLLFRHWAIGDKTRNDGALLLVAPNERKVSIEVGYGAEGELTDAISRVIIDKAILPRFKAGDFAGGIEAGVADMGKALDGLGDQVVERVRNETETDLEDLIPIIIFLVIMLIIIARSSRGRRIIIVPGGTYGGGSWGGGGGWSSGGGYSGGGGSSGGGGASGGW
jgi:uncharacterized protein